MWRLCYAIPTWILYILIWIPLVLLGHLIIPVLLVIGEYKRKDSNHWPWLDWSNRYNQAYQGFPALFWLWANEGDGLYPPEYAKKYPDWSFFRLAWTWAAVRNPVNNLRFVPLLSCKIDSWRVHWIGNIKGGTPEFYDEKTYTYSFFAWCGIYSCYRKQYRNKKGQMMEFWIGWKIWPSDFYGVSAFRKNGAGFAMQWRKM